MSPVKILFLSQSIVFKWGEPSKRLRFHPVERGSRYWRHAVCRPHIQWAHSPKSTRWTVKWWPTQGQEIAKCNSPLRQSKTSKSGSSSPGPHIWRQEIQKKGVTLKTSHGVKGRLRKLALVFIFGCTSQFPSLSTALQSKIGTGQHVPSGHSPGGSKYSEEGGRRQRGSWSPGGPSVILLATHSSHFGLASCCSPGSSGSRFHRTCTFWKIYIIY